MTIAIALAMAMSIEQRLWLEASTLSNRGEMRQHLPTDNELHPSLLAGSQYQTKQMTRCRSSLSDSLSATRNPQLTLIFSYHVLWRSATRNPQLTLIFSYHVVWQSATRNPQPTLIFSFSFAK